MNAAIMTPAILMADPNLLRSHFEPFETWATWYVSLKAANVEPLTPAEQLVFARIGGGRKPPTAPVRELWMACGRRAGKSRIAALLAVHAACCRTYRLAPGERGVVIIVAADRGQAKVIKNYILGFMEGTPLLASLIESSTAEAIRLTNGIDVEVHTCSLRSPRGRTAVCVIAEEVAFWRTDESANPDAEVLAALRPTLASTGGLLVALSTPYARRGELHKTWSKHHGKESDVLVVSGDTRTFNPSVPAAVVDAAFEDDPAAAWAEYGREGQIRFRDDVEGFVTREHVLACTLDELERPVPRGAVVFMDAASGTGQDSFTAGVAHKEPDGTIVLDWMNEVRPPFSAADEVAILCAKLKGWGIYRVVSDRYAAGIMSEMVARNGVRLEHADKDRSALYASLLPLLTSRRVRLLKSDRLVRQLTSLERRVRNGREFIDSPRGGHEDLANAVAGALVYAAERGRRDSGVSIGPPSPDSPASRYIAALGHQNGEAILKGVRVEDVPSADPSSDEQLPPGWQDSDNWV